MLSISSPVAVAPSSFDNEVEKRIFEALSHLGIDFQRVDNEPAVTMDDCRDIDAALDVSTAKTLLLTNRQQTNFYLLAMDADKPFVTRSFSDAMGISRVSFAPEDVMMELLGTERGAATLLSAVVDTDKRVKMVIDRSVCSRKWFGCTAGTVRCYMKMATDDLLGKYMPYTGHDVTIIDL